MFGPLMMDTASNISGISPRVWFGLLIPTRVARNILKQ